MSEKEVSVQTAAKAVQRQVREMKGGKATGAMVAADVSPDEVMASRIDGDEIVVVTTAGEKLRGPAPKVGK